MPGSRVYQDLAAVSGLRKGPIPGARSPTRGAGADDVFQATLPYLPTIVADMARLARLTGMRPTEVCIMRPCDVDTSGAVGCTIPSGTRPSTTGGRVVYIGPKGQDVLRPYLLAVPMTIASARRIPSAAAWPSCTQREHAVVAAATGRAQTARRQPKRAAGERYTKDSLNRRSRGPIAKANVQREQEGLDPLPHWSTNRLRHAAATDIRRQFGLEGPKCYSATPRPM